MSASQPKGIAPQFRFLCVYENPSCSPVKTSSKRTFAIRSISKRRGYDGSRRDTACRIRGHVPSKHAQNGDRLPPTAAFRAPAIERELFGDAAEREVLRAQFDDARNRLAFVLKVHHREASLGVALPSASPA